MTVQITDGEPDRSQAYRDQGGDVWAYVPPGWETDEDEVGWFYNRSTERFAWDEVTTVFRRCFPWTQVAEFVVKDSGVREEYANGFVRDAEDGKPDYVRLFMDPKVHAAISKEPRLLDFLATDGAHLVPPEMLIRWAVHMNKAVPKYGESNWRLARGLVATARFARSFCRHAVQWLRGDRDEDHAAALMFNVAARELTPLSEGEEGS